MNNVYHRFCLTGLLLTLIVTTMTAQEMYKMQGDKDTRWASFENSTAGKGKGGSENKKAKGHPSEFMAPGETKVLMNASGAGIIQRIWLTVRDREPVTLRSLRIEMYWDGSSKPAVSVPLGDFFGIGLGRKTAFQNALFSDPEGRSFNCYIPMPYRKGARVLLINEGKNSVMLFYDINFQQLKSLDPDALYFHAFWSRERKPVLGKDFEILPAIQGRGRYLGMNMGVITDPSYQKSWWGEGEVKIYLDGDTELPTLNGTGTEDYIGTGWGQGKYAHEYQGCLVADTLTGEWALYRYHVPDPVFFQKDCRVTIQLMGGDMLPKVREYKARGATLLPVTVSTDNDLVKLLEHEKPLSLDDQSFPAGWVNFYRQDDVSATAYFYLDKPDHNLLPLAPVEQRTAGLKGGQK
jgi:Protein of unknown function (DUF2961)